MYSFLAGGYKNGGGAQSIMITVFKELAMRGYDCKLIDVLDGAVYKAFLIVTFEASNRKRNGRTRIED